MKTLLQGFYHLLFPNCCAQCDGQLYQFERVLCTTCEKNLPLTGFDFKPGNPVEKIFWGRVPIIAASSFLAFSKKGSVQKLMFQLKYKEQTDVGLYLGQLYGTHIKKQLTDDLFDLIIPIPLHKKKLRKRGYNQCDLIGQGLSESLGIPVKTDALQRRVDNPSQTKRNREERWKNVEQIFEVPDKEVVRNKHILLVDDVVTTGATLESASIPLLSIPGVRISIVTLAFPE